MKTTKTKQYAIRGAVAVGLLNSFANIIKQLSEMKKNPELKFNWKRFFGAMGKGTLVGGAGGALFGLYTDYKNSQVRPINTDLYLKNLAEQVKLDKSSPEFMAINEKAELITKMFEREFNGKLSGTPERLGSTQKGTALKSKFDVDIGIKFKPGSFSSTSTMRDVVLRFSKSLVGRHSIVDVREQRKSIGIIFKINGRDRRIDVVPIKITGSKGHTGYLSVYESDFLNSDYSYKKTSIRALNSVKLSETQKRILLILKYWKTKNGIPISSYLLENLILDAYAYSSSIPNGFTKKVVMVLKHIERNLEVAVIRGVENTNNIITNIGQDKKAQIIAACREAIEQYDYQPNTVKMIFK